MESASEGSAPVCAAQGRLMLPRIAAQHLRAAVEQMDLLLATQQVDAGLCYLVGLLRNLRALRGHLHAADGASAPAGKVPARRAATESPLEAADS